MRYRVVSLGHARNRPQDSARHQQNWNDSNLTDDELLAFLDELLPNERASLIEQTLRDF